MKIDCAHDELVDVDILQPNPRNPNTHPDKQIALLAKIINYQGQRAPIVVSKRSGFITKGHGRLRAIKSLGWDKAAVDYQDYEDEAQEFADMVADNKIAELAQHDDEKMRLELQEIDIEDFDFLGIPDFEDTISAFEVNRGDENSEWSHMPEFTEAEKQFRISLVFNTELERELWSKKNNINPDRVMNNQWIINL